MDAWIGLIGTVIGTIIGGGIAAYLSYREQQREPKLLMLEKRIDAYSLLSRVLYEIATFIHRKDQESFFSAVQKFKPIVIEKLYYLDAGTKDKILALYNYIVQNEEKGLDVERVGSLLNEANRQLFKGIDIKYT